MQRGESQSARRGERAGASGRLFSISTSELKTQRKSRLEQKPAADTKRRSERQSVEPVLNRRKRKHSDDVLAESDAEEEAMVFSSDSDQEFWREEQKS